MTETAKANRNLRIGLAGAGMISLYHMRGWQDIAGPHVGRKHKGFGAFCGLHEQFCNRLNRRTVNHARGYAGSNDFIG